MFLEPNLAYSYNCIHTRKNFVCCVGRSVCQVHCGYYFIARPYHLHGRCQIPEYKIANMHGRCQIPEYKITSLIMQMARQILLKHTALRSILRLQRSSWRHLLHNSRGKHLPRKVTMSLKSSLLVSLFCGT